MKVLKKRLIELDGLRERISSGEICNVSQINAELLKHYLLLSDAVLQVESALKQVNDKINSSIISKDEKKELEIERFESVKNNVERRYVYSRWGSIKKLKEHFQHNYDISLSEPTNKDSELEYMVTGRINPSWGYIDIHYLQDPLNKVVYISEINVSDKKKGE